MIITKKDFLMFEKAKYSGANQIDERDIAVYTAMSLLKIRKIMDNYTQFNDLFKITRDDYCFIHGIKKNPCLERNARRNL